MGMYKVWSMSTDTEQSDYHIEYEARISASDAEQAKIRVRETFMANENTSEDALESWDWMAVKLP